MLVALLCAMATGCSPSTAGRAAVGFNERGELVGYLQICKGHIDGATLYRTENDKRGQWQSAEPVTAFASWSLVSPDGGWTAQQPYVAPAGDAEYTLYGWTNDNSWSASALTFRLSDMVGLKPGEVLYRKEDKLVPITQADFRRDACASF
jgi:hypothetical protein